MAKSLLELINERKQQTGNRTKTIKPAAGRNRYRILPGWRANDPTFYQDFGQHFIKDAQNQIKAVYVCADKTFGKPCDICDMVSQSILQTTDDVTKKRLEDARSSGRVLLNVLALDGPTPTEPQILEIAPSVFNGRKGVGGIVHLFEDFPDLIDPNLGRDVIITKSGTGIKDTAYAVQVGGDSKPVPAEVLKKLHNLDEYVAQESDAAKQRALLAFSQVSGILPPPSGVSLASMSLPGEDLGAGSVYEHPAPVEAAVVPVAEVAPVAAPVATVAPAVVPVAAPVAPVVAAPAAAPLASTGDAELDALLADLK